MGDSDTGARRKGPGFRYEELVITLVFLRCLRKKLSDFEVTTENVRAGKFDDVVVTWRENREKYALLVQLKHKTSKDFKTIKYSHLFSDGDNKPDFNIRRYLASFPNIREDLVGIRYALAISTNRPLDDNAVGYFEKKNSFVGSGLLETGGCIYMLNAKTVEVPRDFMDHFYMLFDQKDVSEIRGDICEELKHLLGSPRPSELDSACDDLCECVMKWKDRQYTSSECLTSGWSEWTRIESQYKSSTCTIL